MSDPRNVDDAVTAPVHIVQNIGARWHGDLAGRESPDQHPISSVTGLREELDALAAAGQATTPTVPAAPAGAVARSDFHGSAVDYRDGSSFTDAFELTDQHLGPLGNLRVYDDGKGWGVIRRRCIDLLPHDRTVVVSSKGEQPDGPDGYVQVLNDIAESREGGAVVWANFAHEHDASIQDGTWTLADYRARAKKFYDTVKQRCPGVRVVQIVMWWSFRDDVSGLHPDRVKSLSPDLCDAYGVDFYNKTDGGAGGPINTEVPSDDPDGRALTAFIGKARADGVPWMVCEWNWDWDEVDEKGTNGDAHRQWCEWAWNLLVFLKAQPDCILHQFFNYTSRQNGRSLVANRQTEPSKVIPLLEENGLEHQVLRGFVAGDPIVADLPARPSLGRVYFSLRRQSLVWHDGGGWRTV